MPATDTLGRRNAIPVLYTRGTHYEVGFDVGRTFSGLIQNFLATCEQLNNVFLPIYETTEGRKVYDVTLKSVRENFPQYIREIEGTADGAKVPFHKLFLLHLDDLLPNVVGNTTTINVGNGCSTICCNQPGQATDIKLSLYSDVLMDSTSISSAWKKMELLSIETSLYNEITRVETREAFLNSIHRESLRSLTYKYAEKLTMEVLGHTEDVLADVMNHIYFVSAHIISDTPQGRWKVSEERFTSLCYAGYLPGFTMSYNHHGLVFSVNIISAKTLVSGKTPRYFITRALLAAENFVQAQQILRDNGCGAADAVSINMTFLCQEGDRLFHNAEVGPALNGATESSLSILTASPGEHIYHCNKFLRLKIPEAGGMIIASSEHRINTLNTFSEPLNKDDVIQMLGDQSDKEYTVFQDTDGGPVKTVAIGIFDCVARTWSIYSDNPKRSKPVVVIPLTLKSDRK